MRTKRKIDDCRECIQWIKGPLTKLPRGTLVYDDALGASVMRDDILAGGQCGARPTDLGEHGYMYTSLRKKVIRVNDRPCRYFDPGSAHEKAARLAEKLNPTT